MVLATELTEELIAEGVSRDLVRAIQEVRKELNCDFTDRIEWGSWAIRPCSPRRPVRMRNISSRETLANSVVLQPLSGCEPYHMRVGDTEVELSVQVAS